MNIDDIFISEESLAAVKRRTLEKAGFVKQRSFRRIPVKLPVAAVILCLTVATVFASPRLKNKLAELFDDDFPIFTQISLVSDYGWLMNAEATDNDITIRIEEAYTNESGALILFSMIDEQNRLTEGASFVGTWTKGGPGSGGSAIDVRKDSESGVIYGILNIFTDESFAGEECELVIGEVRIGNDSRQSVETSIDIGEYVRYDPDNNGRISTANTYTGSLGLTVPEVPGLVIGDIYCTDEGLTIKGNFREKENIDIKGESISFNIKPLNDNFLKTTYGTSTSFSTAKGVTTVVFNATKLMDINSLKECKLVVSYDKKESVIEGDWVLKFTAPEPDSEERPDFSEIVEFDGYKFLINDLTVTKNSLIATVSIIERPPAASGLSYDIGNEPLFPELRLYEREVPLDISRSMSRIVIGDGADSYRVVMRHNGKHDEMEIRGFIYNKEVCRIKLR